MITGGADETAKGLVNPKIVCGIQNQSLVWSMNKSIKINIIWTFCFSQRAHQRMLNAACEGINGIVNSE